MLTLSLTMVEAARVFVTRRVVVDAGRTVVRVLAGCVEIRRTVVVCPGAEVVTVKVEAGMTDVTVDAGIVDTSVLIESKVLICVLTSVAVAVAVMVESCGSNGSKEVVVV